MEEKSRQQQTPQDPSAKSGSLSQIFLPCMDTRAIVTELMRAGHLSPSRRLRQILNWQSLIQTANLDHMELHAQEPELAQSRLERNSPAKTPIPQGHPTLLILEISNTIASTDTKSLVSLGPPTIPPIQDSKRAKLIPVLHSLDRI